MRTQKNVIINMPELNSKYIHGNRTQSRKKGDSGHQKKNHYRFYPILEIITIIKYHKA